MEEALTHMWEHSTIIREITYTCPWTLHKKHLLLIYNVYNHINIFHIINQYNQPQYVISTCTTILDHYQEDITLRFLEDFNKTTSPNPQLKYRFLFLRSSHKIMIVSLFTISWFQLCAQQLLTPLASAYTSCNSFIEYLNFIILHLMLFHVWNSIPLPLLSWKGQ